MTRTCSTPGCDGKHEAKGGCASCYRLRWARERRAQRRAERFGKTRPCAVCGEPFEPARERAVYCSPCCRRFATVLAERERRDAHGREEMLATRSPSVVRSWMRSLSGRGIERIDQRAAARPDQSEGYFALWQRDGGLWVLRVRWPDQQEEEEAA